MRQSSFFLSALIASISLFGQSLSTSMCRTSWGTAGIRSDIKMLHGEYPWGNRPRNRVDFQPAYLRDTKSKQRGIKNDYNSNGHFSSVSSKCWWVSKSLYSDRPVPPSSRLMATGPCEHLLRTRLPRLSRRNRLRCVGMVIWKGSPRGIRRALSPSYPS